MELRSPFLWVRVWNLEKMGERKKIFFFPLGCLVPGLGEGKKQRWNSGRKSPERRKVRKKTDDQKKLRKKRWVPFHSLFLSAKRDLSSPGVYKRGPSHLFRGLILEARSVLTRHFFLFFFFGNQTKRKSFSSLLSLSFFLGENFWNGHYSTFFFDPRPL